jgi:tight adherence protein C
VTPTPTVTLAAAWAVLALAGLARCRRAPVGRLGHGHPTERRRRPGPARRGRRRKLAEAAIADAVPDVIDLFAVAVAAGLNTRLALRVVAGGAPPGDLTDALADVERDLGATGARLADTIERLPDRLGTEAVRPLVSAITDAERYGAALGPTLDRLADDARRSRQRRAEEAARRVPVKLLFPLVTCILPAFGLLTVAPLIAGGLRALRL